jgi:hypothetical protein
VPISFNEFRGFAQAASGDFPHGLNRGLGQGQEDLEPSPEGFGPQYVMTTKKDTTVMSKWPVPGTAPKERRVDITRLVEEAEYLAGTPGVHPRVLAQKVWQARKALMGSSKWSWASYQDPRARYDSYDDLVARLEAVERVLGVGKLSPKIMAAFYGLGGIAPWGERLDPVEKLAQCIRGSLCLPKAFCCPPGRMYDEPAWEDYYPEDPWPEPEPFFASPGAGAGAGAGAGDGIVNGEGKPKVHILKPSETPKPVTKPKVHILKPSVTPTPVTPKPKPKILIPSATPKPVVPKPKPKPTPPKKFVVAGGQYDPIAAIKAKAQEKYMAQFRPGGARLGPASVTKYAMGGLGVRLSALDQLRQRIAAARAAAQAARRGRRA